MHKIFYDAECPICVREMELIMQDSRAGLAQYGITAEAALTYLHVLTDDGVMLQKMAAVRKMYEGYQGFALVKLANLPLLNKLADRLYPWFARHRYQFPK